MKVPVDADITIAELTKNPYAIYERLRAERPVLKVTATGRTLVTKSADTQHIKMHPELFSSDDPNTPMERAFGAKTLMRRDGDDHMRLRRAMMPALTPAMVKKIWTEKIEAIADAYIDRLPAGETVEFFTEFAGPFSARCLAVVLGIPLASDDDIQRWSQTLINGAGNFGGDQTLFDLADTANEEINACISAAVAANHEQDNFSALAVQAYADEPLEMEHIVSNIKIAIGGGINEPRDAILTTLYGLLTNADQLEAVKQDLSLCGRAFEEAVRWVAPIQVSSRLVKEDTTLRGYDIPKGEVLMTIQASANRDEEVYQNGHEFNLFRPEKRHQAFGNGPHFCMGTHLSRRMVGDIALPRLLERFPKMELRDPSDVVWDGFAFRGPLNLPIVLKS